MGENLTKSFRVYYWLHFHESLQGDRVNKPLKGLLHSKKSSNRNPIGFRTYGETSKKVSCIIRNLKIVSCVIRNPKKVQRNETNSKPLKKFSGVFKSPLKAIQVRTKPFQGFRICFKISSAWYFFFSVFFLINPLKDRDRRISPSTDPGPSPIGTGAGAVSKILISNFYVLTLSAHKNYKFFSDILCFL